MPSVSARWSSRSATPPSGLSWAPRTSSTAARSAASESFGRVDRCGSWPRRWRGRPAASAGGAVAGSPAQATSRSRPRTQSGADALVARLLVPELLRPQRDPVLLEQPAHGAQRRGRRPTRRQGVDLVEVRRLEVDHPRERLSVAGRLLVEPLPWQVDRARRGTSGSGAAVRDQPRRRTRGGPAARAGHACRSGTAAIASCGRGRRACGRPAASGPGPGSRPARPVAAAARGRHATRPPARRTPARRDGWARVHLRQDECAPAVLDEVGHRGVRRVGQAELGGVVEAGQDVGPRQGEQEQAGDAEIGAGPPPPPRTRTPPPRRSTPRRREPGSRAPRGQPGARSARRGSDDVELVCPEVVVSAATSATAAANWGRSGSSAPRVPCRGPARGRPRRAPGRSGEVLGELARVPRLARTATRGCRAGSAGARPAAATSPAARRRGPRARCWAPARSSRAAAWAGCGSTPTASRSPGTFQEKSSSATRLSVATGTSMVSPSSAAPGSKS